MADGRLGAFTAFGTRAILGSACNRIGLDPTKATLLRLGQNATYKLDRQSFVVRISRTDDISAVEREVRVAQWLADVDFPTARLANIGVQQPIVADGWFVTVWDYVAPGPETPGLGDLARLLHRLHGLTPPKSLNLPDFGPFKKTALRLERAPRSVAAADIDYLRHMACEVEEAYKTVEFDLPQGPIHADAHRGNLYRAESGEVLLLDLEYFAIGPREWDIAVPAIYRYSLNWMSDEEYREFTDGYGYDVATKSCFPLLRDMRELSMTAWLMQNVDESDATAAEFQHRVATLRDRRLPRRWQVF